MTISEMYRDVRRCLRLVYGLAETEGSDVNVGERFVLRFRLSNEANPIQPDKNPVVCFRNLRLQVGRTDYAAPLEGEATVPKRRLEFPAERLWPGESTDLLVPMRAEKNMGGFADLLSEEEVAIVSVEADLDVDAYFRIRLRTAVREEIHP